MIAKLVRLPAERAQGRIDLAGSFEGALRPDTRLLEELEGLLDVSATDGAMRRKAPPVVAIARASEDLDEFDPNEMVLYQRVETILELAHAQSYATGLVTSTRLTHATPACFSLDGARQRNSES